MQGMKQLKIPMRVDSHGARKFKLVGCYEQAGRTCWQLRLFTIRDAAICNAVQEGLMLRRKAMRMRRMAIRMRRMSPLYD